MIIQRIRCTIPISLPLFALLFFTASCSPKKKTANETIQVLLQNAPESLDPRHGMSAYAATVSELIYASLMRNGEDLRPVPLLAQSVEQLDGVTYRFLLRPELFFHDGVPITARDVLYTFQSLLDPQTSSPHREKFKYIKSISRIDELTVEFVLDKPYAPFLSDVVAIGIVPEHRGKPHNGSGPFHLQSWDRNTNQLVFTPHSRWFEGAPKIPRLSIVVIKDPTTRLLELLKGNADLYVGSVLPKQLDVLRSRAPQLRISTTPGIAYSYLAMNLRGPKPSSDAEATRTLKALANPIVRQAIASAINFNDIIRFKFLGLAERATGLLPNEHWAKDTLLKPIPFDSNKARTLLDGTEFLDRGDDKGGRFALTISTTTDRFRQSLSQIIAASLNDVGIKTTIRIQDWGSLFEDIKQGNFEMFAAKWLPVIEPDLLTWVFHSENIPAQDKGGGNRGAYRSAYLDDLLMRARESSDLETRRSLYMQVERTLADDLPYVPLWFENEIVIQSPRLKGFVPSITGSLFGLRHAWI